MADNTCHFGLNNFFADNGVEEWPPSEIEADVEKEGKTALFFPADAAQATPLFSNVVSGSDSNTQSVSKVDACVESIFWEPGLRFLFTTRSKTPAILDEATGKPKYGPESGYKFIIGQDETGLLETTPLLLFLLCCLLLTECLVECCSALWNPGIHRFFRGRPLSLRGCGKEAESGRDRCGCDQQADSQYGRRDHDEDSGDRSLRACRRAPLQEARWTNLCHSYESC